ncbi:MarC family protein [Porifericola rhodea]|uniref:MarC family protein n=1 Tax=Porifericola rhodea TaxID=930972 RepID=UPI0026665C72|nr:MarC family protein [Porifericola rhodea]WKN32088.1 MarC family protein [Porifericola rhodea]
MIYWKDLVSVTLILFSVIDILGSIPIIIELRKKHGHIQSGKATLVAGFIMITFLFLGESILALFGVDVASFAIAGAIVMFLIGMEMVLGIEIFKPESSEEGGSHSIVPLAFPLLAGAGTMTTLISLRAAYTYPNILLGIVINLILVFVVLKSSAWLELKLGKAGFNILRKIFGIILLSIAIKLVKNQFT